MTMHKAGTTVRYLFRFDDARWNALFPFDEARAEAKPAKPILGSQAEYELKIDVNEQLKTILVSANTNGWPKGTYRFDLRFKKNGEYFYIPAQTNIEFRLSKPMTDGE